MSVAALFVRANGPYFGLTGVDPWPEARDARKYDGPYPVVAHPPCSRWCQLARLNEKRYGRRVGDDGGCFAAALRSVRRFGGVLEHPAYTIAWGAYDLPRPRRGRWLSAVPAEWVTEVSQSAYGHRARKRTWLFVASAVEPQPVDWAEPPHSAAVGFCRNNGGRDLPRLPKREAALTPPAFRDLLLNLAREAIPSPS